MYIDTANYISTIEKMGFKCVLSEDFIHVTQNVFFHYDYSILLILNTNYSNINDGTFYYNWSPNSEEKCRDYSASGSYALNGDSYKTLDNLFNEDFVPFILPKELREKEPKLKESRTWDEYYDNLIAWEIECLNLLKEKNIRTIWSGYHNYSEIDIVLDMVKHGTFVKRWVEQPMLYFVCNEYSQKNNDDVKKKQINKLPRNIKIKIGQRNWRLEKLNKLEEYE